MNPDLWKCVLSAMSSSAAVLLAQGDQAKPPRLEIDFSKAGAYGEARASARKLVLHEGQTVSLVVKNHNPFIYDLTVNATAIRSTRTFGDALKAVLAFLGDPSVTMASPTERNKGNTEEDDRITRFWEFEEILRKANRELQEFNSILDCVKSPEAARPGTADLWISELKKSQESKKKTDKNISDLPTTGSNFAEQAKQAFERYQIAAAKVPSDRISTDALHKRITDQYLSLIVEGGLEKAFKATMQALQAAKDPSTFGAELEGVFAEGIALRFSIKRPYNADWAKDNSPLNADVPEQVIEVPVRRGTARPEDSSPRAFLEPQAIEVSAGYGVTKQRWNLSTRENSFNSPGVILLHAAYRQTRRCWTAWTFGAGLTPEVSLLGGGSILFGSDAKLVFSSGLALSKRRALAPEETSKRLGLGWFFSITIAIPKSK